MVLTLHATRNAEIISKQQTAGRGDDARQDDERGDPPRVALLVGDIDDGASHLGKLLDN
jgi:hypothetical protein